MAIARRFVLTNASRAENVKMRFNEKGKDVKNVFTSMSVVETSVILEGSYRQGKVHELQGRNVIAYI